MKFSVGEKVSLQVPLPYLKTADPISMLRPPDLVSLDEIGIIIGIRSKDLLEVKFRRGNFLIPSERVRILNNDSDN
tara:strand:- start:444 stop:671 length:228 start_codon:yes stop_codon:yes gene_type:complete